MTPAVPRLWAFFERLRSPGFSTCWRCRRPWKYVEPHVVIYEQTDHGSKGAFALCEACWTVSDYDTRWRAMYDSHSHHDGWEAINRAVMRCA